MATPHPRWARMDPSQARRKNKKGLMAKPSETRIAILIQVMDELGFDREIIAKISKVLQRTVSDIANRRGFWASSTGEFKQKIIRGEAAALADVVLKRFK